MLCSIEEGFMYTGLEGKGLCCCLGDLIYSISCRAICFGPGWYEESDEFFLSSYHPGAKQLALQEIEYILSPKQQWRPLPSLLYKSFFYAVNSLQCAKMIFEKCPKKLHLNLWTQTQAPWFTSRGLLTLGHRIIDDRMENSIKGRRIGDNLR